MSNNSLFVIHPYRKHGTWVFDAPERGLEQEPFVAGMPEIIDFALGGSETKEFTMILSDNQFPGYMQKLVKLEADMGGTWYKLDGTTLEGWLCPALFKYYAVAPEALYLQVKI